MADKQQKAEASFGPDIIFFAGIDWAGGNKMPCHHVAERLANRHRVFYIDNFGGIRDLTWSDCGRALRKIRSVVSQKEHREHKEDTSEGAEQRSEDSNPGEAPGARNPEPRTKNEEPNTKHQAPRTRNQVPSIKYRLCPSSTVP